MFLPNSTYRLQMSINFTFTQARTILNYLKNLGITDIYLSPITQAQSGSLHGYDVINPLVINDELGGEVNFLKLSDNLKKLNMGLILDIVPNHMAAVNENLWYKDVLQKFKDSDYFSFFDINEQKSKPSQLAYRRFFDINELICMRVEDPKIFERTHQLILNLVSQKHVTGLRVDHIDGLIDPTEYLKQLSFRTQGSYLIVEKILARNEPINSKWPIQGTTGYDFANELNQLYVSASGYQSLLIFYLQISKQEADIDFLRYLNNKRIINQLFKKEFDWLVGDLIELKTKLKVELSDLSIANAFLELLANIPVYRTYIVNREISNQDYQIINEMFQFTKQHVDSLDEKAIDFIYQILTLKFQSTDKTIFDKALHFIKRWQVFTGPMVAKAYEDTTCYQFYPLLSLNEVGSDPNYFIISNEKDIKLFHQYNKNKLEYFPHALNATSTHDTKRSEDFRARLNVLSESSKEVIIFFKMAIQQNKSKKSLIDNQETPDINDELMIYQSLLGAWPLFPNEVDDFKKRFVDFLPKALREAKTHTRWQSPQEDYEKSVIKFVKKILHPSADNFFLNLFLNLEQKIAFYGMFNSLTQLILKITCPGIPDFYQGNEIWRFDLVDPDNRRPIDFSNLQAINHQVDQIIHEYSSHSLDHLIKEWKTGAIKFYMTKCLLNFRNIHSSLFSEGSYIPLEIYGEKSSYLIGFLRRTNKQWLLVITPRWFSHFIPLNQFSSIPEFWQDTQVILPDDSPTHWSSIFNDQKFLAQQEKGRSILFAKKLFSNSFICVCENNKS